MNDWVGLLILFTLAVVIYNIQGWYLRQRGEL